MVKKPERSCARIVWPNKPLYTPFAGRNGLGMKLACNTIFDCITKLSVAELEQFHASYFIAATFIHAAMSLVVGLAYGVHDFRRRKRQRSFGGSG
jgi:hypothetical protein